MRQFLSISGSIMEKRRSSFGLKIGEQKSWRRVEVKALPMTFPARNPAVSGHGSKEEISMGTSFSSAWSIGRVGSPRRKAGRV